VRTEDLWDDIVTEEVEVFPTDDNDPARPEKIVSTDKVYDIDLFYKSDVAIIPSVVGFSLSSSSSSKSSSSCSSYSCSSSCSRSFGSSSSCSSSSDIGVVPAAYNVEFSGDATVNGYYCWSGMYNGKNEFKRQDSAKWIRYIGGPIYFWGIVDAIDTSYYLSEDDLVLPPLDTWQVGVLGTFPPPLLTAATCSSSSSSSSSSGDVWL